MIIKIKFRLSGKKQNLPLNYQYPISAWIYKIIEKADTDFSRILHKYGYKTEKGKVFKLFTFSKLYFPENTWRVLPDSDRMEIKARNAYLKVSFMLPEQTEKFVTGLFKEQKVFIGDKISGIYMQAETIENVKCDVPDKEDVISVKLKTITATVLGFNSGNQKNEQYFSPEHPDYKKLFLKNLIDKYSIISDKKIDINNIDFKVTKIYKNKKGKIKSELQTIKAGTPAETKIKGYFFEFELTAPADVIRTGLNAGFGSMNALGFGFCELI